MIRQATGSDLEALVTLCREAWEVSPYKGVPFNERRTRNSMKMRLMVPNCYVGVVENNGIQGLIVGGIVPLSWAYGDLASDEILYIRPQYRGHGVALIRGFIDWAKGFASVKAIMPGVSFGGDEGERSERLYERLGFQRIGSVFYLEV